MSEYLTPSQAAKLFGVKPKSLRNWTKRGLLPVQIDSHYAKTRYLKSDVVAALLLLLDEEIKTAQARFDLANFRYRKLQYRRSVLEEELLNKANK